MADRPWDVWEIMSAENGGRISHSWEGTYEQVTAYCEAEAARREIRVTYWRKHYPGKQEENVYTVGKWRGY